MSVNSHHAEQVRNTALGIDMRDPIADGAEGRAESITAMQNQAINALKDQVKQGIEDLNSAVEGGKMRLNGALADGKIALDKSVEDLYEAVTVGKNVLNATIVGAKNDFEEQIDDGIKSLNGTYVHGTTLLFHTMKKDIEALKPIAPEALEKLKPVDEKCETRIKTMTITKLSGNNDYYRLAFTRANGR